MPGGLLQLSSSGQQNLLLSGNPSKSFFKAAYRQYANFALQKFRLDFEGSRALRMNEPSRFTFKVKRYADLLMDCYLAVSLPSIWSPILPPQTANDWSQGDTNQWAPYEFKWIENIGAKMISSITVSCGNETLQEFSGDYLLAAVQRDFSSDKKALFDQMTGNVPELFDPAYANGRQGQYPNAYLPSAFSSSPSPSSLTPGSDAVEPSIRGRTLYIPLNVWFGLRSEMAFPLVALQYNELHIHVTFRPVAELFVIRDVLDAANGYPYVAPNFNQWYMQMHRFLQPPPDATLGLDSYVDQRTQWNADIHLQCTYCFLSNDEQQLFARNPQTYLIRQVYDKRFYNVTGPNKVELQSNGMITNWLFYFQRSDANLRNQWSNYTNWPYGTLPLNVEPAPATGPFPVPGQPPGQLGIGPGVNPDGSPTGLYVTPPYSPLNERNILVSLGILLDGNYRENMQPAGVYDWVEKYVRTSGNAPPGLYCYNYALHSDVRNLQPSGAINMNVFSKIELEFTTIVPPLDPLAQSLTICDPETGDIIGINKPTWRIYSYNYNLVFFEERINFVEFIGGNVGLKYQL